MLGMAARSFVGVVPRISMHKKLAVSAALGRLLLAAMGLFCFYTYIFVPLAWAVALGDRKPYYRIVCIDLR